MTKNKKRSIYSPLIITGYGLFALLVIAVLVSTTIPMGLLLFNPRVLHYNVAVFAITLTVGALLPFFVGYVVGNHSTNSQKKIQRHFNGILFGLLGYWIMTFSTIFIAIPIGLFGEEPTTQAVITNLIPSLLVATTAIILATTHLRSRHAKRDVVDYKPYSLTLISAIILMQLISIVNNFVTNNVGTFTLIAPAASLALGLVAYVSLRGSNLSTYSRVTWAAVSLSVAFTALFTFSMLAHDVSSYLFPQPTMELQTVTSLAGTLLALAGWGMYWMYQRKALVD